MKRKYNIRCKLIVAAMVLIVQYLPAQSLQLNIVNTASNHIQITGTAVGDFQASNGTDDWSSAVLTIRIPTSVGASVSAPAASPDVTNESNNGFGGVTYSDAFGGGLAGTKLYSLTQIAGGCPSDGYVYMSVTDNASTPNFPLSNGSTVVLFEFDLPAAWSCNECIEIVLSDIACTPFFDGTRVGNQGTGTNIVAIGDFNTSLPIELTLFEPRTNNCDLSLYWETATEQNFGYFQIEASKDGRSFAPLGQMKPKSPHSLEKRTYKYPVPTLYQGYYFRLKAVDLDGAFDYSKIVYTQVPCGKEYGMSLYPNPNVAEQITVEISSAEAKEQVPLLILDAFGKVIKQLKVDIHEGVNKIPVDTEQLPSGTYFVKIIGINPLSKPLKFIRSNF